MWKAFWLGLAAAILAMALAHSAPAQDQRSEPETAPERADKTLARGDKHRVVTSYPCAEQAEARCAAGSRGALARA